MTISATATLQTIQLHKEIPLSALHTNPILTQNPNKDIQDQDLTSEKIKSLIENMKEIMSADEKGVGLAAPQIGQNLRIFIYKHKPEDTDSIVVINPKIIFDEQEQIEEGWEGCISLPNYYGKVPRYKKIEITYSNVQGNKITKTVEDFEARVIQHEYDHINPDCGILYIQRMPTINDENFGTREEIKQRLQNKDKE